MARDDINAFLGAGTVFKGDLSFQGAVRIDGIYQGDIKSEGTLIAGKDSKVEGTININQFSLAGNFIGEVFAKSSVVIHKGGVLKGVVHTPALVVEEGAILDANIIMTPEPVEKATAKAIEE